MNWIILILAGLMEVGFTFCLGKTKTATGQELVWWWTGFITALSLSMFLMAKAAKRLPIGTVGTPCRAQERRKALFTSNRE